MSDRVLPPAILESHIGILGKTGSGKSNLAKTIVEGLLDDGARVCVIDPTGTWYGLRLTRARKPSPYQVVMFGGNHADIAIGRTHGAAVAETIGTTATPAVIDTRTMTVGERTMFFTAFAETLLQRNRGPLHLVIDEAHLFAPQGRVADPRSGEMLHAANNLVSLGRGVGLRIILISQRPAKLHKDSLTQVETLVAMRLIAPQDRRAIEDWVGEWADPKTGAELLASLPSLRTGEAWIWSPEAGVLERVQTPLARTLDTGKPSDQPIELGQIDIAAVQEKLGQVAADVLANDPRELHKRIRELEKTVENVRLANRQWEDIARRAKEETRVETIEKVVEVPVLNGQVSELRAAVQQLGGIGRSLVTVAESITAAIGRVQAPTAPQRTEGRTMRPAAPVAATPVVMRRPTVGRPEPDASTIVEPGEVKLKAGAHRMLQALARLHPTPLTRSQTGTLAEVQPGGTFSSYLSNLRMAGLVDLTSDGRLVLTDTGAESVASSLGSGAPTTDELVAIWSAKVKAGARRMLQELVAAYPEGMTRAELAQRAEVQPGGTFSSYLSNLRSNGLIDESQGDVRAGDALFLGAD